MKDPASAPPRREASLAFPRLRLIKGRLPAALVDVLLDGFCALVARDDTPGIPVSNFAELARALGAPDPLPAPAPLPQPAPARGTAQAIRAATSGAVALLALCLMAHPLLHAQSPVFVDTGGIVRVLPNDRPDMPRHTMRDIAAIEANAPSYISSPDKDGRFHRLDWMVTLEYLRLYKPEAAFSAGWYEIIAAKAPALLEPQIDAIAQDWWSAMGSRAVKRDTHDVLHDASFEEMRAHFRTLRTGNDSQAFAAMIWLASAGTIEGGKQLRLPPLAQDTSPLAHLLARDISQELPLYTGPEALRLRDTVQRLIAGKFRITGEIGIEHAVTQADVDALLDAFCANPQEERRVLAILEEWLKRGIDADVQAFEDDARAYRRSHGGR